MSDLISRSALIEMIKVHKENVKGGNYYLDHAYGVAHDHIIDLINLLTVAYDVEKVVEEIKELRIDDNYECIDIVRKGGLK